MTKDNKRRALVVEDEPVIGRICTKTLNALGFEVDIATNGLMARDMVRAQAYDFCLSDIRTPKMNGIEFYQYLRQEHPRLANRVIFTSGDVLGSDVKAFLTKLSKPFLPKPFTPTELRETVKEALTMS